MKMSVNDSIKRVIDIWRETPISLTDSPPHFDIAKGQGEELDFEFFGLGRKGQ